MAQAEDDRGNPITLGGRRLRALLAALAQRANRTVPPETLVAEVWADTPPQDAPAALQALIGRLRRTLGKDAVTSEPGGYRLAAEPDDVDLLVFERLVREGRTALDADDPASAARTLREALGLWYGPALADLPDRTTGARPETLRLEATRTRIEADLHLGNVHDVLPELRELTTQHPYDEPLHALLIHALRGAARHADALAAYEAVRQALATTFGTDPGPELRALHATLLNPEGAPPLRRDSRGRTTRPRPADDRGRLPRAERERVPEESHTGGRGKGSAARPDGPVLRGAPFTRRDPTHCGE